MHELTDFESHCRYCGCDVEPKLNSSHEDSCETKFSRYPKLRRQLPYEPIKVESFDGLLRKINLQYSMGVDDKELERQYVAWVRKFEEQSDTKRLDGNYRIQEIPFSSLPQKERIKLGVEDNHVN
jgi:hypothetical protein